MARSTAQSAVALGGGHGLFASLSALRHLVAELTLDELTAVVTVADNGGSSGRLRGEFGVLPPGDLRMALAALCGDDEWGRTWADVVQHRFAGEGEMRGHVIGNLLIVGLWELMGDPVRALDWVGKLLGARGRVLPMAVTPIDMTAQVRGLDPADADRTTQVRGQVEVATTQGQIVSVALDPPDPQACAEAVEAVLGADWVVLGPGSWFTSVIPHLMVPSLRQALIDTAGGLIVVLNLEPQEGETPGYLPEDHLAALFEHAPDLKIHTVLADVRSVGHPEELDRLVSSSGASLVIADLAADGTTDRHDDDKLAVAFERIMNGIVVPGD
ncbi:gluconeogenesis factor YvcK family protein [Nocardioides allogilvus]|nr:uridine diphosphate-N-acetylglucosamine-binding protein YvcK [Nocardioides allogilvus]